MKRKLILTWILRFVALLILFYVFFIGGSLVVSEALPDNVSEPGLVSGNAGLLIIGVTNTLLVIALVLSSRWNGWKLALAMAMAYYGAVTFLMQIETWFFLSNITVGAGLLPRLFIMGLPVAFLYIPLAVWILGKGKGKESGNSGAGFVFTMPARQWVWKLSFIAIAYLVLYWSAGYFIAWQNPELRTFYGSPGDILPFWKHAVHTLNTDPGLFLFQILRAMLWTIVALPLIRGSKLNVWWTAVLVGLLFSLPQNISHILENPLLPLASVRLSHLIETASSTFVFGIIITWLLHREHTSIKDLIGMGKNSKEALPLTASKSTAA